jgi:serine/threonine protein kinase
MKDPLIGLLLKDTYRLDALLGEGGRGRVYKAYDLSLRRSVAVKLLRPDVLDEDGAAHAIEAFLKETEIIANLVVRQS